MSKLISSSLLILLFFLIVFTRSFAGIYIFGIRLGEYLVAFGLVSSLIIFFLPNKFLKAPNLIHNIFRLIIISFFITLLVTDASFVERYTYKTSSYIWTTAYFFIGYYFLKIGLAQKYFMYFYSVILFCMYLVQAIIQMP